MTVWAADNPWELVAVDPFSPDYHPTFTGNGYFAARVPAAGQGYAATPVETQFQISGVFGTKDQFQVRAGVPAWTTLTLADDASSFSAAFDENAAGSISDYRQVLDLATGVITTSARWVSAGGRGYRVTYRVVADRDDEYRALVRLDVIAEQDGEISVADALDARAATLATGFVPTPRDEDGTIALETQWEDTALVSVLASTLRGPAGATPTPATAPDADSVAQALTVTAHAGHTVTFVKYVALGVAARGTEGLTDRVRAASRAAAGAGFEAITTANDRAWRELWRGDIRLSGLSGKRCVRVRPDP